MSFKPSSSVMSRFVLALAAFMAAAVLFLALMLPRSPVSPASAAMGSSDAGPTPERRAAVPPPPEGQVKGSVSAATPGLSARSEAPDAAADLVSSAPGEDPPSSLANRNPRPIPVTAAAGADDPDVRRAMEMVDKGYIGEAVEVLDAVLRRDPRNEQALVELGMLQLLDLKQPEQAASILQRVVDVNPNNQIALAELVNLYEEQGHVEEGLAYLIEANNRHPGAPELAYGIGQLLSMQGRDTDAIPYLEKASQSPDASGRALRDLGAAYLNAGDSDKAIDAYGRAITAQERDLAQRQEQGQPVQYSAEHIAYTKIDKIRSLIQRGERGDLDEAQRLINDVRTTLPRDESVAAVEAALNRRRAG